MGKTIMGAVVSLDGFMADDNDGIGPLFDWLGNGDVAWSFPGSDSELPPATADFRELFARPAQQAQWARLQELGLNADSDLERSLGRRVVESLRDA